MTINDSTCSEASSELQNCENNKDIIYELMDIGVMHYKSEISEIDASITSPGGGT